MALQKLFTCTVCGQHTSLGRGWFLVLEDSWLDRLKVLHWRADIASQPHVSCLCCAAHVLELVSHWITDGSLAYGFAALSLSDRELTFSQNEELSVAAARLEFESGGVIGELAVHRESLGRVLAEYPQSMSTILQALIRALDQVPKEPKICFSRDAELATA